jgi:2-desacetyl-2-hydroxyethyl bacteriochlorophyllide A dehydrogenase
MHSGISRGTEMAVYRGTAPFFQKNYDDGMKLFLTGRPPSWSYPMSFGYEHVGRIVEAGDEVQGFAVGNIVYTPSPHAESLTLSTVETGPFFGSLVPILKLPADVAPEQGLFLPLLGVAYNAMLDGGLLIGETVAVFGAGVVGLLTVQLCRIAGAERVVIIEPLAARRELACSFGATHDFDPTSGDDVALAIRELTAGRGADLAIEASGNYAALHEAIRTVGYNGRVVVSGYLVGNPAGLRLGDEFHHNRVRIISSQSFGVSPPVSDRWDPARRTLAALAVLPRLELAPMITHRFPFADAAQAFQLLDDQPDAALQIVLDYNAD